MVANANARTRQFEPLNGLVGVLMLTLHKPTWLISANRQDRGPYRTVARRQITVRAAPVKPGVADVQNLARGAFDHEPGPQSH